MTTTESRAAGRDAEDANLRIQFDRVDLIRYSGLSIHSKLLSPPLGFILRAKFTLEGEEIEAWGEVAAPGTVTDRTWEALNEAADALQGSSFAANDLPKRAEELARFAPRWTRYIRSNANLYRFANLALESLFTDVQSRIGAVTLDEPGSEPISYRTVPRTEADRSRLRGALRNGVRIRLRSFGNPEADAEWLTDLHGGADGDVSPVWLRFKRPLSLPRARSYLRKLCALLTSGPRVPVVLEDIVDPILLRFLERTVRKSGAPVEFASRRRLNSLPAMRAALAVGPADNIVLDPNEWGTYAGLREAAEMIERRSPQTRVWLKGARFGGVLTRNFERRLGNVDTFHGHLMDESTAKWSGFDPEESDLDAPRNGPQLPVDLLQLAPKVDRYVSFPSPPATDLPEPNDYSDDFLPGLPTGLDRQWFPELAAMQAGLATRRFGKNFFLIEQEGRDPIGFNKSQPSDTPLAGARIAWEKGTTRDLLIQHGLPIASGFTHPGDDPEGAVERALDLGFPLVVKPEGGSLGLGITTGIDSEERLRDALASIGATKYAGADFIIERHVEGDDYRIIATPTEVLAVIRRDNAELLGDGRSTIEELILRANSERRRNPNLCSRLIAPDEHNARTLRSQGLGFDSTPLLNEKVRLSTVANLSRGGSSTDVLSETHPSILELARQATSALGLNFAGVDVLLADHRKALDEQAVTITEMNHNAAILLRYPMYGQPRDVCDALVRQAAERAGMTVTPMQETLDIRLSVQGGLSGTGYAKWIRGAARRLELGFEIIEEEEDLLVATVAGPAMRVAGIVCLATRGYKRAGKVDVATEPNGSRPPSQSSERSEDA